MTRWGFLAGGIIAVLIGFGSLLAVANSVAHCPAGYICEANPVGLTLGAVLLVFGLVLIILAFVLKKEIAAPPTSPARSTTTMVFPGTMPPRPAQNAYCAKCGAPRPPGAAFCASCGAPF